MASKIKGITVEIGGDTTKLSSALKDVNQELASTQGDLKQINRLLKLDPGNTELLAQKQRNLSEAIQATKDKLGTLQKAADQASKKLELGEITVDQYEELRRNVIAAERSLADLEDQAADTARKLQSGGKAAEEIGRKMKKVSDSTSGLTKGLGLLAGAVVAAIPATEDLRDGLSKLEVNAKAAGRQMRDTKDDFAQFYAVTGEADSSIEALSNLLQTGFNDNQIEAAIDALSGAVIRFPDTLKIESLADSLQETIKTGQATGQYAELLDRLGISADEVTKSLQVYSDETARASIALSALATSGLTETAAAWEAENQTLIESRNAHLEMQQSIAALAEAVTPLVTKVIQLANAFMAWFNDLSGPGQAAVGIILALVASISPITGLVSNIINIVPKLSGLLTPLNIKIMAIVGALVLLVGTIVAVADAWKNMTGMEKVLSVLGLVAAAAAVAAVAIGALAGPAGAAVAAGMIVAGIGTALAAVSAANARAKKAAAASAVPSGGGSYGGSYGGGYGGQGFNSNSYANTRTGAPGGNQPIVLELDGREVARGMMPQLNAEQSRIGTRIGG